MEFIYKIADVEDTQSIMDCIYEEYQDTYFRIEYYDYDLLSSMIAKKQMYCFMAVTLDGEIAGVSSLIYLDSFEGVVEISAGLVREKYRNQPIFAELIRRQLEFVEGLELNMITIECVTNHPVSQFLALRQGFKPIGFLYNYFTHTSLTERIINHSEGTRLMTCGLCAKVLKNEGKRSLYLPIEIKDKVLELYDSLGLLEHVSISKCENTVACRDTTDELSREMESLSFGAETENKSCFAVKVFMKGDTAEIKIKGREEPSLDELKGLVDNLKNQGVKTVLLYIKSTNERCRGIYEIAKKAGFFFTGIMPNIASEEYIFMTHLLGNNLDRNNINVISDFESLNTHILDAVGL